MILESIKHFFSQLVQLYTMYIYIYNLFCSLDFHDQKRWMNFINLKLLLTFPLVNDSKFLWQIPLRFPNAPVMWIPETRKAYHQQTPEGDDGFVRGWDGFLARKIKAEKKNWNLTHLYRSRSEQYHFLWRFFCFRKCKNWIIICKV